MKSVTSLAFGKPCRWGRLKADNGKEQQEATNHHKRNKRPESAIPVEPRGPRPVSRNTACLRWECGVLGHRAERVWRLEAEVP